MTLLEYALAGAARGWSIIPLQPRSKTPAIPWKDHQHRRATPDEIRAWWQDHPDRNVGVVTGAVSNLAVIDVDPRNGGSVKEIAKKTSTGYLVKTGGGGMHFYCAYTPSDRTIPCQPGLRPGVDLKGEGGYVLGAGSIHPSGEPYELVAAGQPAPLPVWVFADRATVPHDGKRFLSRPKEPWIADALAHKIGVGPGEQEETLAKLCWYFSRELPQDIATPLLLEWAAKLPLHRPSEPWTPAHVTEKIERAYAKRRLEPPVTHVDFVDAPSPRTKTRQEVVESIIANHKTAAEFALETDTTDWIVPDFVAPGAYTELIGLMKKGKSTLVCDLMRAMLHGTPFLDRPTAQTPVVYMTEQAGVSLKKTLDRGRLLNNPDLHLLLPRHLFGVHWPDRFAAAVALAERVGARVIVIDTFHRLALLGGDAENQSGAVLEALMHCEAARAKGLAVVFVRHSKKSSEHEDVSTAGRGSGAFTGDMDICILHSKPLHDVDLRRLRIVSRLAEVDDIWLKYEDGSYHLATAPVGRGQRAWSENDRRVVDALGKGRTTVTDIAKETGLHRSTVKRHLEQLDTEVVFEGEAA